MNTRTPFAIALLSAGFSVQGAQLIGNFNTSNSDTACMSFLTPMIRVLRFTTPNYPTQLQSLTTRMAVVDLVTPPVAEIRTGVGTNNAGSVVHTMTPPTFIFGGVRTYTYTSSGFTFQPNMAYGLVIRGTTTADAGSWYYADPILAPSGLGTWVDTRRTYNGTSWAADALIPRFTLVVADPTQVVSGALHLNDTVGSFVGSRTLTYTVKQGTTTVQTGTIVSTATTTPFSFTLPTSVTGAIKVAFDGSSFLRRTVDVNLAGSSTNMGTQNLINGDTNYSGEVDPPDIDRVVAEFGSQDPTDADVNVSGEVDPIDLDIVVSNFGSQEL